MASHSGVPIGGDFREDYAARAQCCPHAIEPFTWVGEVLESVRREEEVDAARSERTSVEDPGGELGIARGTRRCRLALLPERGGRGVVEHFKSTCKLRMEAY